MKHWLYSRRSAGSRGFVLVSTIVCLMIASAITANVMRRVLRQRQESRQRLWHDQADWLAVSGIQRAQAKLAVDPEYPGETWLPNLTQGAQVSIQCDDQQIEVIAHFPFDEMAPHQRARVSRTVPRQTSRP